MTETKLDQVRRYVHARNRWDRVVWNGRQILKYPTDLFVFQQIIFDVKPTLIVETGTFRGGSASYFSTILDMVHGPNSDWKIVTVDSRKLYGEFTDERILPIRFDSANPALVRLIKNAVNDLENRRIMVFLDSCHSMNHVSSEMQNLWPLVSEGSYMVVEDTFLSGNPVFSREGDDISGGPKEAVEAFLMLNKNFTVDKSYENFVITQNPGGLLRRNWIKND